MPVKRPERSESATWFERSEKVQVASVQKGGRILLCLLSGENRKIYKAKRTNYPYGELRMEVQDQKLEQILGYARADADKGMVASALLKLRDAKEYAGKKGIGVPQATLQEIETTAYRKGVVTALCNVRDDVRRGITHSPKYWFEKAKEYAGKVGMPQDELLLLVQATAAGFTPDDTL